MNFFDNSRQNSSWDRLDYVIAAPGASNILLLDGKYDPDQLWLDLGHVFIYKPAVQEVEEKKKTRYRKKIKWEAIHTTEHDYLIYDYIPNHYDDTFFNRTKYDWVEQYRIMFPEGRLLKRNRLADSDLAAVFLVEKRVAQAAIKWVEENAISFWQSSENARREPDIRFESDDDAIRFKLTFGKDVTPAAWWKRSKP